MSDTDLLDRLLAGEQTAYRELVARYQGAMRAVAYAIVGSRHADEVVQDPGRVDAEDPRRHVGASGQGQLSENCHSSGAG